MTLQIIIDPARLPGLRRWRLGRVSHLKAQKRTGRIVRYYGGTFANKVCALMTPWSVDTYPGANRYLTLALGIKRSTAQNILASDDSLSRHQATRLAQICREQATTAFELAAALEAYASRPPVSKRDRRRRGI